MRRKTLILIFCAALAVRCFAEAELDLGAGGEAVLAEDCSPAIEPFIKGAASLTAPLSEEWSALADTAARIGYGLPDQETAYFGYAAADLTYRKGRFFGRIGAVTTVEDDTTDDPSYFDIASDTEFTLDFQDFTLSFAPNVRWIKSDTRRVEAEGALWSIISAGDQAILRARLEGGIAWPEAGDEDFFAAAGIGFSLYPAALLVVSADVGFRRSVSDNTIDETIDGSVVAIPHANGYDEYSLSLDVSGSLARDIRFTILAPVLWRLSDHGAVEATAISGDTEWLFGLSPAFSLEFSLSPSFSLKATCGAELAFSNSSYLEERAAYLRIESVYYIR